MNKSESKYYNTSLLMNQALVELLNKKDYEYITVKEICQKAGVNRSTFYLHYETVNDLLEECMENINKRFFSYFDEKSQQFMEKLKNGDYQDMIFITPEYLTPYLTYIKENKTIYQVSVKHPEVMRSYQRFNALNEYILKPVFQKFGIDEKAQRYMTAYYINGVNAVLQEWIRGGCKDETDRIEKIIIDCVRPSLREFYENQ